MARQDLGEDELRGLPKVVLLDHLLGGLRPTTVLELADEAGPTDGLAGAGPVELGSFGRRGIDRVDLVAYLASFDHTHAVAQTPDAIHRIAAEFVEDLAADGVVHGEVRFAPERHTRGGLSVDSVLEAATSGMAEAAARTSTSCRTLVSVDRATRDGQAVAEAAVRWRDRGTGDGAVAGLDVDAHEQASPTTRAAMRVAHAADLPLTINASATVELPLIRAALRPGGAVRLGHGVRLVEDISIEGELGTLAAYVRDLGIPLELCPTSNVASGAVTAFEYHPMPLLRDLGFHVTINPDNRLLSTTSATEEFASAVEHWDWDLDDLEYVTAAGLQAAFLPLADRRRLLQDVIRPGFEAARQSATATS